MNYNEQLKKIRQKLGLSQSEMADKFGFTQSYYSALERGAKEITATVIDKLIKELNVNPAWFYSSIGSMFITDNRQEISKIGILRKEKFIEQLAAEDQKLVTALKEIPELSVMVRDFINEFDMEELEKLSSIGAAWAPGIKFPDFLEPSLELDNDAYEKNMSSLLFVLSDHKKSVIDIWVKLINFLKQAKEIDRGNKINLPGKYLNEKK